MVAVLGQTPVATPAAPPIPVLSDKTLGDYLRSFALWARTNLSAKLPMGQALHGVMLQAYDTTGAVYPAVYLVQVQVPVGGGAPALKLTQVAIGSGEF